jgi:hypothetical protein
MKYRVKSLMIVTLGLCSSISLWSQARSIDNNRLFTLPPGVSASVSAEQANADTVLSTTLPIPDQTALQPVILNFDNLPGPDWTVVDCSGGGTGTVSHGVLTINSPSDCYEYILFAPKGTWNQLVSNSRGWIVETSLIVDPISQPGCNSGGGQGSVQIWANDHTILLIVGFDTNEICIAYPDKVYYPMNTTDAFHIYRIEAKGMHIRIYVDGNIAIDHILSWPGAGTQALAFGDGDGSGTSLTRWDYFSSQVFP